MSSAANPLSEGDIAASNVLPAFETSLRFGASEAELAAALGWRRELLVQPDAAVSGASTYRHMELMFERPAYPAFVIAAARAHDAASLGIVGLACKTMPTVADAMACHARFQRLVNRTATYASALEADGLHVVEHRPDPSRGSVLVSDYAMLVAVRLIAVMAGAPVPVRAMFSRRTQMSSDEREVYERELAAPVHLGATRAALVLAPELLRQPVPKADAELERYFREILERALPRAVDEPPLLAAVRRHVRASVRERHPTLDDVAAALAIGARTLQRRLGALGTSYQQVLDETLAGLAEGYLRQPELTLAEIAWLLGYVEQASFFRAFRRWTGSTPDAFRRRASASASG
ncbi:MAG: AraC family transcriptional regulator ligand-binding domain-containing protein [Nannocystaceae bacterium]|nr:AraC family transcriptional regulator ligand-binding domain-containing protein [Nannocystaceae bacterium]